MRSGLARCRTGTPLGLGERVDIRAGTGYYLFDPPRRYGLAEVRSELVDLAADLHVGDVGIQVEAVDAGDIEADVAVRRVVDVHHAGRHR